MACNQYKKDSNITGLRFAEEECIGELPETGVVFYPLEPNSYDDFGGETTTVSRNPINPSRSRKKGTVVDVNASGGFNQDVTQTNLNRFLQGFFFADVREKASTIPMNGTALPITGVVAADKEYNAASGLTAFIAGHLIKASGFGVAANNGIKTVVSSLATEVVVSETVANETPPSTAKLEAVGFRFGSGVVEISTASGFPRLLRATGTLDFTTLGLIPGEWVHLGGDGVGNSFTTNRGFARVNAIAATYIEFDKTDWTPGTEAAGTLTVQMFFGNVIRNETNPALIKRRTYHLERTLGEDMVGPQAEYLVGSVPNELTLNAPQADKLTIDLSFVSTDHVTRTGTEGLISGTRPSIEESDAYNTSSDFTRIKLATVDATQSNVTPLFAFLTELELTINNNVTPNKALGVMGAFDASAGTFAAGGSMTAYFSDVMAVRAVRNNADVTFDAIMVKKNAGALWDIPLLGLGDGRLNVEVDQPITIPLEMEGAESKFGHSMLFQYFSYLPNMANA